MGDIERHLRIAREKLAALQDAYERRRYTVVGDLAIKVIEQLVEADAASQGLHFGSHYERQTFAAREYPQSIRVAMKEVWFSYGDLGYDGANGEEARRAFANLKTIIKFLETRLGRQVWNRAGSSARF